MLEYLTLILICQLTGEIVTGALGLPVPGPVLGMLLLFIFLSVKGDVPEDLGSISNALLNNLSLMFVPAGVGVMVHFELLGADVIPLSAAVVGSTVLTIAVTALAMTATQKRFSTAARTDHPDE